MEPEDKTEYTLVVIKPDSVEKKNIGNIVSKLEGAGLFLRALQLDHLSGEFWEDFYEEHKDKEFFSRLVGFMASGEVAVTLFAGEGAINIVRRVIPEIREEFAETVTKNAIHGSDSAKAAKREIGFFFKTSEEIAAEHFLENATSGNLH